MPIYQNGVEIIPIHLGTVEQDFVHYGGETYYDSFEPVDMMFNTSGTFTFNAGRANRVTFQAEEQAAAVAAAAAAAEQRIAGLQTPPGSADGSRWSRW